MISVLALVRNQPILRSGLQACVAFEPSLQWLEPLICLSQLSPDVVLVDADAAAEDTQPELDTLQRLQPFVPLVVLKGLPAERGSDFDKLAARAACVLDKSASPRELVVAIQSVHRGERGPLLAPAVASFRTRPTPGPGQDLTRRERDLLKLLAEGFSNQKIAVQLGISLSTVKSHVMHILSKLEVENRTAAVLLALRCGLLKHA